MKKLCLQADASAEGQRIDKYLADMGIGTRSEVKKILKSGQVTLNGEKIKKSGRKIPA